MPVSQVTPSVVSSEAGSVGRSAGASPAPFAGLVDQLVGGAVQSNTQAQAGVQDLALGRTDSLHEVMLQVAQADLSFRLILEIRNRLTDAYQEIMKMQV
ncbi:MAG TPA: flagellar hook-basal body complex protein FliE [Gemmataceae bacterium]|nr:flagellar hook-basal body complex protein FliE [Gemmataceae bacterium]